jgi:hypothetical protein
MANDRDTIRAKRDEAAAVVEEWTRRLQIYNDLLAELGGDDAHQSTDNNGESPKRKLLVRVGEPKNLTVAVKRVLRNHGGNWMRVGEIAREVENRFPSFRDKSNLSTMISNTLARAREKKSPWLESSQEGKNWSYRYRVGQG